MSVTGILSEGMENNLICETYGVCPIYRANCRQGFFSTRREERMKRRNFEVVQ